MGITVCSGWQILNFQPSDCSGFRTKIGCINDDQFFSIFGIEQRKNKVRGAKTRILNFYIVGK